MSVMLHQDLRRSPIRSRHLLGCAFIAAVCATGAPTTAAEAAEPVRFNRDIRPILSQNCFFCHGPDKNKRKAGLRLDEREAALKKEAFVPGAAEKSALYLRLVSQDPDELMPPPESHKHLSPGEIALLKRWIDEGATYEPHWAYVPVVRPPVPVPRDTTGLRNPIDAFVRARLEREGLAPSPPADPRTLLRRASLDLLGLPPTPEEMDAFERDPRPDAYERALKRFLASPHYGERMAVPWLDAVRFADTVGYHGDQNQNVFPYRDWVIDAFNSNLPFDQFVTQQLAGDLLPRPTQRMLVATAFNRLNMMTREGGAQAKEYLAKYMADRVRTIGTALLGSTVGCAECHDHKYDPFSTKDFYSLGAFFADVKEWGIYHSYHYTPNPELRGWDNDHPFPPEIEVPSRYLAGEIKRLARERAAHAKKIAHAVNAPAERARFSAWRTELRAFLTRHPDGFAIGYPRNLRALSEVAVARPDGFVEVSRIPDSEQKGGALRIELQPGALAIAAIRLELTPKPWPDFEKDPLSDGTTVIRPELRVLRADSPDAGSPIGEDRGENLAFHHGDATVRAVHWNNTVIEPGIERGWRIPLQKAQAMTAVLELATPIVLRAGDVLRVILLAERIARVRVSVSPAASGGAFGAPPHVYGPDSKTRGPTLGPYLRKALAENGAPSSPLAQIYLRSTGFDGQLLTEQSRLFKDALSVASGRARVQITVTSEPRPIRILPRGNWQDESGPVVTPAPPEFLPRTGFRATGPGGRATRLDLARWLTARDNPLVARVFVNRLWRQLFGTGLSAVLDDLGAQGEPPSHPELLDWLAAEFMESGWDVKRLVSLMMTSATYRQSARVRPELLARDPDNRLLARQSQRRLDAEFVRDNALFVAGLLDLEVGGPSVRPYQPDGHYDNLQFPARDYVPHVDRRQYRRGVYVHWQRTFLHPMLVNFDAPPRDECTADRPRSNTPQQALTLLNDPSFVEAARVFAERVLKEPPRLDGRTDDGDRIDRASLRALGRRATDSERAALLRLLADERRDFFARPEDARRLLGVGLHPRDEGLPEIEHAAWTSVCRALLNLYDAVTRS